MACGLARTRLLSSRRTAAVRLVAATVNIVSADAISSSLNAAGSCTARCASPSSNSNVQGDDALPLPDLSLHAAALLLPDQVAGTVQAEDKRVHKLKLVLDLSRRDGSIAAGAV